MTTQSDTPRKFVPIDVLVDDPHNPRKTFDKTRLKELADSFNGSPAGIQQDLVVRPHPSLKPGQFMVVFGHRRKAAAKLAGLSDVPVRVENMTDEEALEYQLVENLQREDVHPVEEAEAFFTMSKTMTYEQIAQKVGKSKALIFRRLQLVQLTPKSRDAYRKGLLTEATAFMLARVPKALQDRACEAITTAPGPYEKGKQTVVPLDEPMTAHEVSDVLSRRFMLPLAQKGVLLPFNPAVKDLVPGTPACKDCTKRTGAANKLLFADIEDGDICTDPTCYEEKANATFAIKAGLISKAGGTVIDDPEQAKKFYPYGGFNYELKDKYVPLNETAEGFSGQTVQAVLEKAEKKAKRTLPRTLVQHPGTYAAVELVNPKEFRALAVETGLLKQVGKSVTATNKADRKRDPERERQQREQADRKLRRAVVDEFAFWSKELDAVPAEIGMRALLIALCEREGALTARLNLMLNEGKIPTAAELKDFKFIQKHGDAFRKSIPGLPVSKLQRAVVWAALYMHDPYSKHDAAFQYVIDESGVDLKKLTANVKADAEKKVEKAKEATAKGETPKSAKSAKKAERKAKVKAKSK